MALTNAQYESIMRAYEQIQTRNRHIQEERREQVYLRIPKYRELEQAVASMSVSQAKLMLDGDEHAMARLRTSLEEIAVQKKALLQSAGFSEDYLEPVYSCPNCRDTGYLTGPEGLRQKCACFHRREIDLLYEQSNIQDAIRGSNFSLLSYEYYQGEDLARFQKCVEICKNFTKNFKQDYRNLFFYGTVGTGKSFLSECIANQLLQTGQAVLYFSSAGLFDTLARYSFDAKAKEALCQFTRDLYQCDLVIIDDLGTEVTNSFVASQLFSLLNERHLRQKSTLISTNLSLEELRDRYSDRVFSRITSYYTICKLTGPDIRMYKKRHS